MKSLETDLKNNTTHDNDKGTIFYMDSDVLQSNLVDLNEKKMIEMYGDWIVES
jgi:hypothetical protein